MNKHAKALGKLAKGKPKSLSAAERARRAKVMKKNQKKRWK